MKNILIITIGTRDVQTTEELLTQAVGSGLVCIEDHWRDKKSGKESISKIRIKDTDQTLDLKSNTNDSFSNFYIFSNPRPDGEALTANLPACLSWLTFPLIERPLEWLQTKVGTLEHVLTVYTDQPKPNPGEKDFHWKSDTIHFNQIIKLYLKSHSVSSASVFEEYPVTDQVANIDFQYDAFEKKESRVLKMEMEEVEGVYLLAQGGIDQINMALTLRLIEHFPGKVKYLQQPEDKPVVERRFPTLFLRNMNRSKALSFLERYEFGAVEALVFEKKLIYLARLGQALRSMDMIRVHENLTQLFRVKFIDGALTEFVTRINQQSEAVIRQELLFVNALIELEHGDYNEATWRFRTLGEILLAPNVREFLSGIDISNAEEFTNSVLNNPALHAHFEARNVFQTNGKWIANAHVLRCVFDFRYQSNPSSKPKKLSDLAHVLNGFDKIRNQLVHSANPVSKDDFEKVLSVKRKTTELLTTEIREYLRSIGSPVEGKGIVDSVRRMIQELLV
jgi:hypothetical protein